MLVNTEELRLKRLAQKIINFNILLLGPKGIGKKTFFTNLCNDMSILSKDPFDSIICPNKNQLLEKDSKPNFKEYSFQIKNNNQYPNNNRNQSFINLNSFILDIGTQLDNSQTGSQIKRFLEDRFDGILNDEIKIHRLKNSNDQNDSRIHLCLYFIDPNLGGLNELDFDILKKIKYSSNLVFVIGKSDLLSKIKLIHLQKTIRDQIKENYLRPFNFGNDTLNDVFCKGEGLNDVSMVDEDETLVRTLIDKIQPFPIICGNIFDLEGSGSDIESKAVIWKRKYYNKEIIIEDFQSSQFVYLKGIILGSHLQDFKETTNDIIYERYRSEKLLQVEQKVPILGERSSLMEHTNSINGNTNSPSPTTTATTTTTTNENMYFLHVVHEKNQIIEAYKNKLNNLEHMLQKMSDGYSSTSV